MKTTQNDTDTSPANNTLLTYNEGESEDWKILHCRLGHVSYKRIEQLLEGNSVGLIKLKDKRRLHMVKSYVNRVLQAK